MLIKTGVLLLLPALALAADSPFRDLFFEPNLGQAEAAVRYVARTPGANLAVTEDGLILQPRAEGASPVHLRFSGASRRARFEAQEEAPETSSYFLGRDETKWVRDVPHFRRLAWRGVYPGIDVIFYGHDGRLEYDFVVAPGADPSAIRMTVDSAARFRIGPTGDLSLDASHSAFQLLKPVVTQNGGRIDGSWSLSSKGEARFRLGPYARNQRLVIDPVLTASTYYGGEADDSVTAITSLGDIVGVTSSLSFGSPGTRKGKDIFAWIAPPYSVGRVLFLGGSGDDVPTCAYADNSSLAIGGWTNSTDLSGATALGGTDGLLISVSKSFSYPTFTMVLVGGSGDDRINAIFGTNNMAFAGQTTSADMTLGGQPLATQPAGGMDAFVGRGYASQGNAQVLSLNYFGGSGDDSAEAVLLDNQYRVVIAGKTTSPDLPLQNALASQLNGPSDGFITRFGTTTNYAAPASLNFSTYFGGSGDDDILALAWPGQTGPAGVSVFLAGVTSSSDLPVLNPAQANFGGGDTDGFVARLDLDIPALAFSTFLGGAGHDEATALAMAPAGVFGLSSPVVTGWTTSTDLPVSNAFQSKINGPQDALLAWYDPSGALQSLSYFGGSGAERGLSLSVSSDSVVTVAGDTSSADLPMPAVNSAPSQYSGGLDGFAASFTLPSFMIVSDGTGYWTANGMVASGTLFFSRDIPGSAKVTITSADPTLVQVSFDASVAPSASVTLPLAALSRPNAYFSIMGMADSGQTTVTVSVDGFSPQQVPVTLAPAQIYFYSGAGNSNVYPGTQNYVGAYIISSGDPAGSYLSSRAGASPPTLSLSLSDPTLGTLSATSIPVPGSTSFQAMNAGTEVITAASSGLPVANPSVSLNIVYPTFTLGGFSLGKYLERTVRFGYIGVTQALPGDTFTVTSDDPSRLCIVSQNSCSGSVSLPASYNAMFTVRALSDNGVVNLNFSSGLLGSGSAAVQLTQPQIIVPASTSVATGITTAPFFYFGSALDSGSSVDTLMAGFDPGATCTSGDPTIATASLSAKSFTVTGVNPGQTTITVSAPGFIGSKPMAVTVYTPGIVTSAGAGISVGKDLQAYVSLNLPSTPGVQTQATVTSSDPSLVLVSSFSTTAGSPQATACCGVYLQALQSSGTATITVSAPGLQSVTFPVTLAPAGYAWGATGTGVTMFTTPSLALTSYALDPGTGLPLAAQALRPGATEYPAIASSNPSVGKVVPPTNPGGLTTFSPLAPGATYLTLAQPAGFTSPSVRTTLEVVVNPVSVAPVIPLFMGRDLQSSLTAYTGITPAIPFTLSSDDPTKLLVSNSATAMGSGQITATTTAMGYLQALDSSGIVNVRVSGPGVADAVYPVTLTPAGVELSLISGEYYPPSAASLTTDSAPLGVSAYLFANAPLNSNTYANFTLRPGAAPLQIPVSSSNPGVAQVSSPSISFVPGSTATPGFTVIPNSPGNTEIGISPPPSFHTDAIHEQFGLTVTLPSFTVSGVSVARDYQVAEAIQVSGITLPSTIIATVTSNDPTHVLVSTRSDTAGQAQIFVPFSATSGYAPGSTYYLQGIAEGQTTVTISGTGFADTTFTVTVAKPTISLSGPYGSLVVGGTASVNVNFGQQLRPGAQASVNLHSSDPTVATVDSSVTLAAGSSQATAKITPVAPGSVTISADLPDGYTGSAQNLSVSLKVSLPSLPLIGSLSNSTIVNLGNNLQVLQNILQTSQTPLNLTVTSSDPSKVLISTDPKAAGQASVTQTLNYYTNWQIGIQGVSDNGSATVTLSAPGYLSQTVTVNLYPAAFSFTTSLITLGKGSFYDVQVFAEPIISGGSGPGGSEQLRGGLAPVSVAIASSQPSVGTLSSPLTFNPGDTSMTTRFTSATAGSTTLTITQPPGFVAPPSNGTLVVSVN